MSNSTKAGPGLEKVQIGVVKSPIGRGRDDQNSSNTRLLRCHPANKKKLTVSRKTGGVVREAWCIRIRQRYAVLPVVRACRSRLLRYPVKVTLPSRRLRDLFPASGLIDRIAMF